MGKYTARVVDQLILPARVCLTTDQQDVHQLLGRRSPEPTNVQLLIDTGSSRSTLVPSVIDQLDPLVARDQLRIETSLASGEATLFWVRLEFPGSNLIPIGQRAAARLAFSNSLHQFHGVIGRDLLRR